MEEYPLLLQADTFKTVSETSANDKKEGITAKAVSCRFRPTHHGVHTE